MISMNGKELKLILSSDTNKARAQKFNTTKEIKFNIAFGVKSHIYIDEYNEMWCIPHISQWNNKFIKEKTIFHMFSDIKGFEVQDESKEIIATTSKTKGGLGSAVVGGLLFGPAGAIVGGMTGGKKTTSYSNSHTTKSFTVHIVLNNIKMPCVDVYCNNMTAVNEITSVLQLIIEKNMEEKEKITNHEKQIALEKNTFIDNNEKIANALKNFKELLDMGIITEDEFETKKKKLLYVEDENIKEYSETEYVETQPLEVKDENIKEHSEVEYAEVQALNDSNDKEKKEVKKTNANNVIEKQDKKDGNISNKFSSFIKSYKFIWILFVAGIFAFPGIGMLLIIILRILALRKEKLQKEKILYKFIQLSRIEMFFGGLFAWPLMLCGVVMAIIENFGFGLFMFLAGISCFEFPYQKLKSMINIKWMRVIRIMLPIFLFVISMLIYSKVK